MALKIVLESQLRMTRTSTLLDLDFDCVVWKGGIDTIVAADDLEASKKLEREAREAFGSLNSKNREIAVVLVDIQPENPDDRKKTKLFLKGRLLEDILSRYEDVLPRPTIQFRSSISVSARGEDLLSFDDLTSDLFKIEYKSAEWEKRKELWTAMKVDTAGPHFSSDFLTVSICFPGTCSHFTLTEFILTICLAERETFMSSGSELTRESRISSEFISKIEDAKEYTDVILVSADGVELPCHKCFLFARSDFFKDMLNQKCKTRSSSKTQMRIHIKDISGEGLKEFLHFIYSSDVNMESIKRNPMIALELLEASHAYSITSLQDIMMSVFQAWPKPKYLSYSDKIIELGLRLFQFSKIPVTSTSQWTWRVKNDLKVKSIEILKRRAGYMLTTEAYKTLQAKDASTAKEICILLMEHNSSDQ